jgi:hypothetical protein
MSDKVLCHYAPSETLRPSCLLFALMRACAGGAPQRRVGEPTRRDDRRRRQPHEPRNNVPRPSTGCRRRVPASTVRDPNEHQADLRCAAAVRSALQRNSFVGTVPAAIALLPAVASIDLADNALTGELPAAFWTNPLSLTAMCARRSPSPHHSTRTHAKHSSLHCTHARARERTFTRPHARAPRRLPSGAGR